MSMNNYHPRPTIQKKLTYNKRRNLPPDIDFLNFRNATETIKNNFEKQRTISTINETNANIKTFSNLIEDDFKNIQIEYGYYGDDIEQTYSILERDKLLLNQLFYKPVPIKINSNNCVCNQGDRDCTEHFVSYFRSFNHLDPQNLKRLRPENYGQFLVYCVIKVNELYEKLNPSDTEANNIIDTLNKIRILLFSNEEMSITGIFHLVSNYSFKNDEKLENFNAFFKSLFKENFDEPKRTDKLCSSYDISNTLVQNYIDHLINRFFENNPSSKKQYDAYFEQKVQEHQQGGNIKPKFKKFTTKIINDKTKNIYIQEGSNSKKQYIKHKHQFLILADFRKMKI